MGNEFGTVGVAVRDRIGDLVDVFGACERAISIEQLECLLFWALELAPSKD